MDDFIIFALLYSFGFGICNGMTYMVPMHHGWLWFPDKPGLISGIIIGGFGLGALVFAPLASALVNPEGELAVDGHFSPTVTKRVPHMLLILDICFLGVCIISWLLIFPGPDATDIKQAIKEISAPTMSVIEEEIEQSFSITEGSMHDDSETSFEDVEVPLLE